MKTLPVENKNEKIVGYYSALILSLITLVTFGFAITAVPSSGAFCLDNCFDYPYLNTLQKFPKDYYWMFIAIFQIFVYLVFVVSVHTNALLHKKIFSQIALTFSIISGIVLLICYFIQFSVVPASLMNGETQGIALLTQYNPHGIFMAMEELGYIAMSFSFLFLALVFGKKSKVERAIRLIFKVAFVLAFAAFVFITLEHGIVRKDRFEIIVISINWLVLAINGVLVGVVFKRSLLPSKKG
jgi:hypothetical protein